MRLFALHGFLGLATDFRILFEELKKATNDKPPFHKESLNTTSIDYLSHPNLQPHHRLEQWGQNLNQFIFDLGIKNEKKVLLGYSQGARLAMQAYQDDPQMWDHLILISGNPGLPISERATRLAHDERWAERFLKDDFQETVQNWNRQGVFAGSKHEPLRDEASYDKQLLSLSLKSWSVAWQSEFVPYFLDPQHSSKFQVFYGDRDLKYKSLYQEIGKKNPRLSLVEIEDSGHRVIFDQPARLAENIAGFLGKN